MNCFVTLSFFFSFLEIRSHLLSLFFLQCENLTRVMRNEEEHLAELTDIY